MKLLTYEYLKDFILMAVADKDHNFIPAPYDTHMERKGTVIRRHICLRWLFDGGRELQENAEAKYLHYWFLDSIGEHTKLVASANRFVSLIKKTGLLRNAHIKIENWDDVCREVTSHFTGDKENKPRLIHVYFDVDKVSSPEIFLVGNILRTIQLRPNVVYDFFSFVKLHPDVPIWTCFIIAHALGSRKNGSNHSVGRTNFAYVKKSAEGLLKTLEDKPTAREKPSYTYHPWDNLIMETAHRKNLSTEYSKELFMSFTSEKHYLNYKPTAVVSKQIDYSF